MRSPVPPAYGGRRGFWFAAIWLFFLAEPLARGWQARGTVAGLVGTVLTVVFGVVYMSLWVRTRGKRMWEEGLRPPLGSRLAVLAVLVALGTGMTLALGESGLTAAVYVAVACVMSFHARLAAALVLAIMAFTVVIGLVGPWGSELGLTFSVMAASVAVYGIRAMIARNIDLYEEQAKNAELAVENERSRFARDLHDILGHSLTVITVKAELARRLVPIDPERAERELADLERLSRDAMADVRRAVEGYRELTLPGELARARMALESAGVEPVLPNTTDDVPTELRELFAWTVREGVTNVIRHSGAERCEVTLTSHSAEVRDDGRGRAGESIGGSTLGNGLAGLRERATEHGASVVVTRLDPGFALRVALTTAPAPPARPAAAAPAAPPAYPAAPTSTADPTTSTPLGQTVRP